MGIEAAMCRQKSCQWSTWKRIEVWNLGYKRIVAYGAISDVDYILTILGYKRVVADGTQLEMFIF